MRKILRKNNLLYVLNENENFLWHSLILPGHNDIGNKFTKNEAIEIAKKIEHTIKIQGWIKDKIVKVLEKCDSQDNKEKYLIENIEQILVALGD